MRLENFDLESPFGAIVLQGLGHHWDLHGFARFQGFSFDPERDELTMEWRAGHENPWGSDGNNASGCRLRFSVLRFCALQVATQPTRLWNRRRLLGSIRPCPDTSGVSFGSSGTGD